MGNTLTIVAWHNIESTWHFGAPPGAGTQGFARQIAQLRRLGSIVPLEDSIERLQSGRPLPARAIALTFDDGYRDTLPAAEILRANTLPATFFLVPDLLDGQPRAWWEILAWAFHMSPRRELDYRGSVIPIGGVASARSMQQVVADLKRLSSDHRQEQIQRLIEELDPVGDQPTASNQFLDGDDAIHLIRQGFAVGSHTMTHPILSQENRERQEQEIVGARRRLQKLLDMPVNLFAYPSGRWRDFDDSAVELAQSAGFQASLTTQGGVNIRSTHPHKFHRIVLQPHRSIAGTAFTRLKNRLTANPTAA